MTACFLSMSRNLCSKSFMIVRPVVPNEIPLSEKYTYHNHQGKDDLLRKHDLWLQMGSHLVQSTCDLLYVLVTGGR